MERVRKALGPHAPASLGIWSLHAWIYWFNTHNTYLPIGITWQIVYASVTFVSVVIAILHIGRRDVVPSLSHVRSDILFALAMSASTIVVDAAEVLGLGSGFSLVATLVGGAGLGWLYIRWGFFYSRISLRSAVACLFLSSLIAVAARMILGLIPGIPSCLFACTLPLIGALSLGQSLKRVKGLKKGRILFHRESMGSLWKAILVFFTFSLVNAFLGSMFSSGNESSLEMLPARMIEAMLSIAVLVWIFWFKRRLGFANLWRIVFLFMAIALTFETFAPGQMMQTSVIVATTDVIVLFLWLSLSDISRHCDAHPYAVFGLGWCAYSLPLSVAPFAVQTLASVIDTQILVFSMLLAMSVVACFCLETRDRDTILIFDDLSDASPAPQEYSSIDERCEALGRQRGLTSREIEVMQLLCKGNSKAYIAEKLFVTENTTKGHVRHIYAKLNVHSKTELQSLIGL